MTQAVSASPPPEIADTVVVVSDLCVDFVSGRHSNRAVDGLSFSIRRGETLAIVGESGSGKSVSASALLGLLPSNAEVSGSIEVVGHDIQALSESQLLPLRANQVSMIFQDPLAALDPYYSIGFQLGESLRLSHPRLTRSERRARAIELLRLVQIPDPEHKIDQHPFQLSGGQAQRVIIAMALAGQPALLIADEPTTALDVTVQAEILDLLRDLRDQFSAAILLITHDMGVVADLADRVLVMKSGKSVETGSVAEIFARPEAAYTRQLLDAVPRLSTVVESPVVTDSALMLAQEPTVLSASGLVVSYHRARTTDAFLAVNDVSFEIRRGETLGIVGESGSGKSTIGRGLLGLVPFLHGEVQVDGVTVDYSHPQKLRAIRRDIGVVFQNPADSLNPRFTLSQSVSEPLRKVARMKGAQLREKVDSLFETVGLPGNWNETYPHEISGGQRQRVAIARALALSPKLVIADEPTSALDVSVQARILDLLRELQETMSFSCLFISHDLAVVEKVCHSVVVMQRGEMVERGPASTILRDPAQEYTKRLIDASPVPDPVLQRIRREARHTSVLADTPKQEKKQV